MLLFALLWGCSDIGINEIKKPSLIVAPDLIEFGHLESGWETDTRRITISNGGAADLVVERIEISGENYSIDKEGFTVKSGEWHQIEVAYIPKTFEHNEGYVDIYLKGDSAPSATVLLDGYGDAPVITINPVESDFGAPLLGCDMEQEIQIQNDGNLNLEINEINLMSSVPMEITIDFGTLPDLPWDIPPGGRVAFFANYEPLDLIDDITQIDVASNDPETPITDASIFGAAVLSNEQTDSWMQEVQLIIDIIWIVDNSGSMMPYQNLLAQNMQAFMNVFLTYAPDFKMMFITTDDHSIVGQVIDINSADPVMEASNIINSIGTRGSGWEKGLEFFNYCISPGGECRSHLRSDAMLVAIFLSDEPDHSNIVIGNLISNLYQLKPGLFSPYAIIGDVPGGCNSGNGLNAAEGLGYWDFIQQYSSQWWSICDTDWGGQMEEIAETVSIRTEFPLSEPDPHIDTIKVWINGQLIEEGWKYDEENNTVVFDRQKAPQPGDSIDISYSPWGCGDE